MLSEVNITENLQSHQTNSKLCTLSRVKFSADDILNSFLIILPENRFWHIMQIVSNGDNLHAMWKPIFAGKK